MSQGIVPVVFGTTGHVDHGKSTLVLALTGTGLFIRRRRH